MPDVIHDTSQYANNRAEQSHEATRVRERGVRKLKSVRQAQRFLGAHAAVSNLKFLFKMGKKPHNINAIQKMSLHGPVYIRIFFSNCKALC
jgi:transposase-like protein